MKKKRSPKGAVSKPPVTEKPVAKEGLSRNPQCSYCGSKKYSYHGIKAHLRTCMKKHKGVVKFPPKKEQNEEIQKLKDLKKDAQKQTQVIKNLKEDNIKLYTEVTNLKYGGQ